MARFGPMIVRALAHCAVTALGAVLVIQALNSARGRTPMSPAAAAAGGAMDGCIGGLIRSLTDRREDHGSDRSSGALALGPPHLHQAGPRRRGDPGGGPDDMRAIPGPSLSWRGRPTMGG
jgi:hypothetical protein